MMEEVAIDELAQIAFLVGLFTAVIAGWRLLKRTKPNSYKELTRYEIKEEGEVG